MKMRPMTNAPLDCPRCRKALYPISTLRPRPKDTLFAKMCYLLAGLLSASLFMGSYVVVKLWLHLHIPTKALGIIMILPALIPGILISLPVSRLPKVLRLRCKACGWGESFSIPRQAARPAPTARVLRHAQPAIGSREIPDLPQPESVHQQSVEASDSNMEIVDDSSALAELKAWVYAAFIEGRMSEEITEALCARGWPRDDVEILVEETRRKTRHRRA